MKKLFISMALLVSATTFAQSDKYVKAMEAKVGAFDTTYSVQGLADLANTFERIAAAEKTQWLPYYYAALANVNMGTMMSGGGANGGMTDKLDPIADKAESLITIAEGLDKNNAEIYIVKKMIASLRMMADPMNRYMKYGPIATEALEAAKKLDAENPRIYMLEGQDKFYTPEQFGGSKTEAKKLFEQALAKFGAYKPQSSIHPSWGRSSIQYHLSQIK